MLVSDVMTKDVATLSEEDTLEGASKLFFEKNISGAPVVRNGKKLVGIVTEADILRSVKKYFMEMAILPLGPLFTGINFVDSPEDKDAREIFEKVAKLRVKDVMVRNVITIYPDETVENAILKMLNSKVNRLPVVDGDGVVGIVSRADLLRGVAKGK